MNSPKFAAVSSPSAPLFVWDESRFHTSSSSEKRWEICEAFAAYGEKMNGCRGISWPELMADLQQPSLQEGFNVSVCARVCVSASIYSTVGCCVSMQIDAFHTCHQQLVNSVWPEEACANNSNKLTVTYKRLSKLKEMRVEKWKKEIK